MAQNEHKNLSDVNRHNPKGFEVATNNTVLSKNAGTSESGTDGNLTYQSKSLMGVTNYKMQGFLTGATNYFFGEDIADTKSPFEMAQDIFRIGHTHIIPEAATVTRISGWMTSNGSNVVTIAIVKATPTEGATANLVPTVVDEIAVTGLNSNNKMVRINETTITAASLAAGDLIFPMAKEASGGSTIYLNLTIETTTF